MTNKHKKTKVTTKANESDAVDGLTIFEIVLGEILWAKSSKRGKQEISEVPLKEALKGKEFVGLYFGAQWSSVSTDFTPQLIELYQQANAQKANTLEIVYVSSDQTQDEFDQHYTATMPWTTMESSTADQVKRKNDMVSLFKAFRIPCFVLLHGPTGKFITEHGRKGVLAALETRQDSETDKVSSSSSSSSSLALSKVLQEWREAPRESIQEGSKGIDYGGGSLSIILYFMNRPILSLACVAAIFLTPLLKLLTKNPTIIIAVLYILKRVMTPSGDQNLPAQPLARNPGILSAVDMGATDKNKDE